MNFGTGWGVAKKKKKVIPINFGMTFVFGFTAVGLGGRYYLGLEPPERPGDGVPPPDLSFHHEPHPPFLAGVDGQGL